MEKSVITVIGSYAVGMTIKCNSFPVSGETVEGKDFQLMHGGKGSNQAVACARLGASVNFATCVGNDNFGQMCYALMEQEGINVTHLRNSEKKTPTGVGFVCVDSGGANEIIISLAANYEFSSRDIDAMQHEIKNSDIVLMQLEMDMKTVEYTASKCKEFKVPFVLNVAPYKTISNSLLKNTTYIILNEIEARQLIGFDLSIEISDEEVSKKIIERGVETVIMTLGKNGSLIVNKNIIVPIPAIETNVVDTTGAGDVFCGAFCVAISEGEEIEDAVRYANICAGLTVMKYGVVESIPNKLQLAEYMEEVNKQ